MNAHRLPAVERKQLLIDAAMPLAEQYGYDSVSRSMVAEAAGISESLVSRYWTAPDFHAALLEAAIVRENLTVLAQGLAARHPVATSAPLELRQAAAATLI